jgi:hypothetical protein
MATKAPVKRTKQPPEHGEYRTDGKRLVRVLDPGPTDTTWVEDAQTGKWEKMTTKELQSWELVRGSEAGHGD